VTPLSATIAAGPSHATVLRILTAVAEALDRAHSRGVVHGDLTPGAVLVDGRDVTVVFDGATAVPLSEPSATLTGAELTASPYAAPERLAGRRLGHRADVYSLGCLAFALLTGSPPYPQEGLVPLLLAHGDGCIPRATDRNRKLPAAVDAVLATALAPEPTKRHPSAADLVRDLEAALGGRRRIRLRPVVAVLCAVGLVAATLPLVRTVAAPDGPFVTASVAGPPIAVGLDPSDIEAGEGYVWTANRGAGSITRIEPATGATVEILVGDEPVQLAVDEGAVFVRTFRGRVARVEADSGAVGAWADAGAGVGGMTLGAGSLWFSHVTDGTVTRLDARTLAAIGAPIPVGPRPRSLAFGDSLVHVLLTGDSTTTAIDPRTGAVVGAPVELFDELGGLEVEDGVVYVAVGTAVTPIAEAGTAPGEPYPVEGFSYFEVGGSVMWVVYDEEDVVRRLDIATRRFVGEPLTGVGRDVGRARFAYGRLWVTIPVQNSVISVTPTT
jgi:hypothetical protein